MRSLAEPACRDELLRRIAAVEPSSRARWGSMSAHGMICHLTDSFQLALGEKQASAATGLVQRTIFKWVALYVPAEWPKNYPTRPEMAQGVGGTPPGVFIADREALIRTVRRFCATTEWPHPHPIFGTLSRPQWLRWGWLHGDHHLRQFQA